MGLGVRTQGTSVWVYSTPQVDRILLRIYYSKFPTYPIFYLLQGNYRVWSSGKLFHTAAVPETFPRVVFFATLPSEQTVLSVEGFGMDCTLTPLRNGWMTLLISTYSCVKNAIPVYRGGSVATVPGVFENFDIHSFTPNTKTSILLISNIPNVSYHAILGILTIRGTLNPKSNF